MSIVSINVHLTTITFGSLCAWSPKMIHLQQFLTAVLPVMRLQCAMLSQQSEVVPVQAPESVVQRSCSPSTAKNGRRSGISTGQDSRSTVFR
eukprot:jgi/Botrbrau1/15727/Bobra.4_1s0096.1